MSQEVIYYSLDGAEAPEHHRCVARTVNIGGLTKHFIKFFEYGPQRGLPVNPYDPNFSIKLLDKNVVGDYITRYKECPEEAVHTYLNFLKTQNDLYFRKTLNYF